jgi:hypothetical protein
MGNRLYHASIGPVVGHKSGRFASHADCFSAVAAETLAVFELVDVDTFRKPSSASSQVRLVVEPQLHVLGWKSNIDLLSNVPIDIPKGLYGVDFQKIVAVQDCDARHMVTLELCFDNRQAIVANLAKADMAAQAFEPRSDQNVSLTFLAVVSKGAKKSGGWDNAVGTIEEYEYAIDGPYRKYVESPIRLITIN